MAFSWKEVLNLKGFLIYGGLGIIIAKVGEWMATHYGSNIPYGNYLMIALATWLVFVIGGNIISVPAIRK